MKLSRNLTQVINFNDAKKIRHISEYLYQHFFFLSIKNIICKKSEKAQIVVIENVTLNVMFHQCCRFIVIVLAIFFHKILLKFRFL